MDRRTYLLIIVWGYIGRELDSWLGSFEVKLRLKVTIMKKKCLKKFETEITKEYEKEMIWKVKRWFNKFGKIFKRTWHYSFQEVNDYRHQSYWEVKKSIFSLNKTQECWGWKSTPCLLRPCLLFTELTRYERQLILS